MDWKPFSVVLFCSFYAVGNGVMAAEDAQAPDAMQVESLQMAMVASASQQTDALTLSSLALDLSPGAIVLSVDERLQLREEIRKAARDIYSETQESSTQGDMSPVSNTRVRISP